MEERINNKEAYIYLDLNEKISNDCLSSKMFIRIADLHKPNPLVQVNDILFKGSYSHSIGTNLFFEKTEPRKSNLPCIKEPSVTLKPLLKQTKVLLCKPLKVQPQKAVIPDDNKNFEYNWSYEYSELLRGFEEGTLQLHDIIKQTTEESDPKDQNCGKPHLENEDSHIPRNEEQMDTESHETKIENSDWETADTCKISETDKMLLDSHGDIGMEVVYTEKDDAEVRELQAEYEALLKLARRPVKRVSSPELTIKCEPQFQSEYEYKSIEAKVLHAPYFTQKKCINEMTKETLSDHVDIERCVLYGLINPSKKFPRTLTEEEKEKIFTLENFDNLSLTARYDVFKKYLKQLELFTESLQKIELENKDEYGRTPMETLRIYQRLCKSMESRIAEINLANERVDTEDSKEKEG